MVLDDRDIIEVIITVNGHEAGASWPVYWGAMSDVDQYQLLKVLVKQAMEFYEELHVRPATTKD